MQSDVPGRLVGGHADSQLLQRHIPQKLRAEGDELRRDKTVVRILVVAGDDFFARGKVDVRCHVGEERIGLEQPNIAAHLVVDLEEQLLEREQTLEVVSTQRVAVRPQPATTVAAVHPAAARGGRGALARPIYCGP